MHTNEERVKYLLHQFAANTCSRAELDELFAYFRKAGDDDLQPLLDQQYDSMQADPAAGQIDWNDMYTRVLQATERPAVPMVPKKRTGVFRLAAAAAILLAMGAGGYWWFSATQPQPADKPVVAGAPTEIAPGGNRATLTVSDGPTIVLDSLSQGTFFSQPQATVSKQNEGELVYSKPSYAIGKPPMSLFHTLTTPRGGEYKLSLPDGTKVWLNASSTLKYPVPFHGDERLVILTGEAYFEVAHDAKRKFIVHSGPTTVEVFGTRFNINAYPDEPTLNTTLVEGSVRVESPSALYQPMMLKPGQQAQAAWVYTSKKDAHFKLIDVDVEPVIAWTRNSFSFSNVTLAGAMRQIERWYDVEIVFRDDLAQENITANIPRNIPISRLMHKLSLTGHLHYTIEGRKITITR